MFLIGCHSSRPGFECALVNAQNSGAAPLQLSLHLSVGIVNEVYWRIKNRALWKESVAKSLMREQLFYA